MGDHLKTSRSVTSHLGQLSLLSPIYTSNRIELSSDISSVSTQHISWSSHRVQDSAKVSLEFDPAHIGRISQPRHCCSPRPNCRREAAPGPLNGSRVWTRRTSVRYMCRNSNNCWPIPACDCGLAQCGGNKNEFVDAILAIEVSENRKA